jgi:hypothetical protein
LSFATSSSSFCVWACKTQKQKVTWSFKQLSHLKINVQSSPQWLKNSLNNKSFLDLGAAKFCVCPTWDGTLYKSYWWMLETSMLKKLLREGTPRSKASTDSHQIVCSAFHHTILESCQVPTHLKKNT